MTEDQLWETARKYHLAMSEEIANPADMLGVMSIIMTNVLVAGRIAGLSEGIVDELLASIKADIALAVTNYETASASIQ